MKAGDTITIQAVVLRVDSNRVDAQTPNGQLIQTDVSNVATFEGKAVTLPEHKAILNAPENKSRRR